MDKYKHFSPFIGGIALSTQEKAAQVGSKKKKLYIGIPKELSFQERRIALTPETVALLVNRGHRVVIESGAGEQASFSDRDFAEVGAEIVYDVKTVFKANCILKVAPLTHAEIDLLQAHQTIFSPIHLPTLNMEYVQALMKKKVTTIAYEYIKDEAGSFPFVRTLSEIAGNSAILIAAEYLNNSNEGGKGILLGGISGVPPAKIVVLGAGVVGEFATRAALGLGATVQVFDNNIYKLMRLQNNLNVRIYTSTINPDLLGQELANADAVIGAIHSESGRSPCIVTEEMVANMPKGSVIVDVSIDQGGCFETSKLTSHKAPIFTKFGVIHYCVPNISSRVAHTASYALSHVLSPMLLKAYEAGGFDILLKNSDGTRRGLYIYRGYLTNKHLSNRFNLHYTDIDLLLTTNAM